MFFLSGRTAYIKKKKNAKVVSRCEHEKKGKQKGLLRVFKKHETCYSHVPFLWLFVVSQPASQSPAFPDQHFKITLYKISADRLGKGKKKNKEPSFIANARCRSLPKEGAQAAAPVHAHAMERRSHDPRHCL